MKITVFGANGQIGRRVVRLLLDHGHQVRAAVHRKHEFPKNKHLEIVTCDVKNKQDVSIALRGSKAVVSCLGSWGTPSKDILSTGMKRIIPAMKTAKIDRIFSLTGSDVVAQGDQLSSYERIRILVIKTIAKNIYHDGQSHLDQLEASGLDWTVVRSPVMSNRGTRAYALGSRRPAVWQTIHRDAVASALVSLIDDNTYHQAAPFIQRSE